MAMVQIEVWTNNDAFQDGRQVKETADILQGIVDRMRLIGLTEFPEGDAAIQDSNGNTCGSMIVREE